MSANSASSSLRPVSLAPYNTFGINQYCRELRHITTIAELKEVTAELSAASEPFYVLGGGSNLVLTSDVDMVMLKMDIRGIEVQQDDEAYHLTVSGGESWHYLVSWTLRENMPGLENLALIPGTVGAAPIQNIGAYGVELKDFCEWVEYLSPLDGSITRLTAEQCEFGYRESIFKAALKGKAIITRVGLKLVKAWQPRLGYAPLNQFDPMTVSALDIFNKVIEVRRSKLPDPAVLGNAGSFFKNPVVDAATFSTIVRQFPDAVAYAQDDGRMKLAAGWLIDKAGLKGFRLGNAGVHEKQALVLVNLGGASGAEVCALARHIITTVEQTFGVTLEAEPNIVGDINAL
ncbi:UDP-N-acetylmuramate dehydrogenase [Shewanella sp. JM162201]|uniref:UDP-N-acetylenolpyruvoylglucosamine reductase n=1 Tax=Shewanella jiangmenensis TaxID=2837387 RepID=A0ABS5V866_9GAMM|nr:UDP-N-acetylmuramate dehydrogenase [Shewanella jiangmenensis]MBT1446646.1 UDP-N-acetylmuramate dehydrogenase [Shewanella jiangmenensis]